MTFDRKVYDENPDIGFMTYGQPVFEALIAEGSDSRIISRRSTEDPIP